MVLEEDLTMNQHMDPSRAPELTGVAENSPSENLTLAWVEVDVERPSLLVRQEPTTEMPLEPGRWAKRAGLRRKDATAKLN